MKSENSKDIENGKMKEYAEELKSLKDEELDKAAAGYTTTTCQAGLRFNAVFGKCVPDSTK